jgi:hypothetical protein
MEARRGKKRRRVKEELPELPKSPELPKLNIKTSERIFTTETRRHGEEQKLTTDFTNEKSAFPISCDGGDSPILLS